MASTPMDGRAVGQESTTCPDHAGESIVGTCARCGRFICAACAEVQLEPECAKCTQLDRLENARAEGLKKLRQLAVESVVFGAIAAFLGGALVRSALHQVRALDALVVKFLFVLVVASSPFLVAAALLWRGELRLARPAVWLQLAASSVLLLAAPGLCSGMMLMAPLHSFKVLRHLQDLRDGKASDDPDVSRLVRRAARRQSKKA